MTLEAIKFYSQEVEDQYKSKWCKIEWYLRDCGMALENTTTSEEMLTELDMTHNEYIKAVWCSIVRQKLFLKQRVCEIWINNSMKNLLQFWRANHDIQPVIDPYAIIEYIFILCY